MPRKAQPVHVSDEERIVLDGYARKTKISHRLGLRARIVLHCAEGLGNHDVARKLGCGESTVRKWRKRWIALGLDGLDDGFRSGAPRKASDDKVEEVVRLTIETTPEGATHWSTRSMASKVGLSKDTVARIWRAFGLKPHRSTTFQISTDPFFIEKVRDVVGLYMDPPDNALVLSVDEKSQIQALNRTQPVLPMRPGQLESGTPEYERNGTTTLFAALDVATGHVIGRCYKRHRTKEFVSFLRTIERTVDKSLDVHLVLDNYATHKAPDVRRFLSKHPRYHFHFVPTHSSWLNMVEGLFGILTERQLKRGNHLSVRQPETAIQEFLDAWNKKPTPFRWTKTADEIIEKVGRFCGGVLEAHTDQADNDAN
jgi:transposase